jgi:hypothetical protein
MANSNITVAYLADFWLTMIRHGGVGCGFGAWISAWRHFKGCRADVYRGYHGGSVVPFKFNSKGRHHIPRQRHRVTNWRDYDTALRNRGSLTIWFTEEALAGWKAEPRTTPGGQRHYSNLAIETALTLRAVFRLALRQREGLIESIMRMLDIDLPVPDHTTLSRPASGLPVPLASTPTAAKSSRLV